MSYVVVVLVVLVIAAPSIWRVWLWRNHDLDEFATDASGRVVGPKRDRTLDPVLRTLARASPRLLTLRRHSSTLAQTRHALRRVFAYRVPLNPSDPRDGEWATLVRPVRLRVGDCVDALSWAETTNSLHTVRGSSDQWEVIAIEPSGAEGPARLGRKLAQEAIWDGTLVLRLVG
jgi:hypothetical protein